MMQQEADIRLLIGVAKGGPDGDSAELIQKELDEIMKGIKAKVTIDSGNFKTQLRKQLEDISKDNGFSINIPKIKIGENALTDFKKQLEAILGTLNIDKNTSLTLTANGIGKIKNQLKETGTAAKTVKAYSAEMAAQLKVLNQQQSKVGSTISNLHTSELNKEETAKVQELTDRYADYAKKIDEVKKRKQSSLPEIKKVREELIAEGKAILQDTQALAANTKAVISSNVERTSKRATEQRNTSIGKANTASVTKALNSLNSLMSDVGLSKLNKGEQKTFEGFQKRLSLVRVSYDEMMRSVKQGKVIQQADRTQILENITALNKEVTAFSQTTKAVEKLNEAQAKQKVTAQTKTSEGKVSTASVTKAMSSLNSLMTKTENSELTEGEQNTFLKYQKKLSEITVRYDKMMRSVQQGETVNQRSRNSIFKNIKALNEEVTAFSKTTEAVTKLNEAQAKQVATAQKNTSEGRANTASVTSAISSLTSLMSKVENSELVPDERDALKNYQSRLAEVKVKYDEMMRSVQQGKAIKQEDRNEIFENITALNKEVTAFSQTTEAITKLNEVENTKKKNTSEFDIYDLELNTRLSKTKGSVQQLVTADIPAEAQAQLQNLVSRYAELNAQHDRLKENKDQDINQSKTHIATILEETKALQKEVETLKKTYVDKTPMATDSQINTAYNKIDAYIKKNPRVSGASLAQLESIRSRLYEFKNASDDASKQELTNLLSQFEEIDEKVTTTGKKGNTLVGVISSAYKKFGGWMLVTKSLTAVVRNFGRMITNVRNLDAAMTELKKVTDETRATYEKFFDEASDRASSLGATLSDTITATADFARLGYSIEDAAELADAALVYKNVGDGIEDISTASESVISTMKAFGIEAENAMTIVDKFNEVGNNFAISSSGIGEALVRSASALSSAGNSLDESIALITAANNVVQNPETVGEFAPNNTVMY